MPNYTSAQLITKEELAMFITFECSQCHGGIEIDVQAVGAHVTCPHCQAAITVPRTGLGAGTTIGGFKIISKLGGGGMGEVYLARQLSMDRDVALKILPSQLGLQKDLSTRFLNEVKLLAKLEHPHIVMAHEAGEDAGVLYLAMAYVEGESLWARLQREGPFSERAALAVARKLAGALAYAWNRHKLLHRDIKPSNVLLDREGEPKLVDFGLAKSLGADTGMVVTNMIMGTPNYMSPEQIEDTAQVDSRADMYSLGALMYNLVTGEVPFAGTSVMKVIQKQIAEPLPDPREYNAELSEGCVILMEILLAKDREKRHGNWEAVIADIDRVAAGKNPAKVLPAAGLSTLKRNRNFKRLAEVKAPTPRIKVKSEEQPVVEPVRGPTNKNRIKVWSVVGVAAGVVILAGVILFGGKGRNVPGSAQGLGMPVTSAVATALVASADARVAKLNQIYLSALEYVSSHPDDFGGSIGRLEAVRKDGAGTEYEQKAIEQIQKLEAAKRQKVEAAWQDLKQAAEKLADQKQYAEGIARLEQYAGPYAAEMASDRKNLAEEWAAKDKAQKEDRAKQQEAAQNRLNAVMAEAARRLLQGNYEAAAKFMAEVRGEETLLPVTNEIAALAETVTKVAGMDQVILASYNQEKGREAEVEFRNGKVEKLRIAGVSGGKVKGKREISGGFIEREFSVSELSLREKTRRLGADPPSPSYGGQAVSPAASIMRGLLAYEGGDGAVAEANFKEAGQGLGTTLAAEAARQITELQALKAYRNLVRMMGAGTSGMETEKLAEWIQGKTWSPAQAEQLARGAQEFRTQYGESALARSNDVALVALAGLSGTPQTPRGAKQPAQSPAAVPLPVRETFGGPGLKKEPASPAATVKIPSTPAEKHAHLALMEILKLAGVGTDLTKSRDLMRQVAAKGYPEADAAKIQEAVTAFEKTHGETETAKSQWRLLDFLKQAGPKPRPPLLQATEENVKRAIDDWRVENHGNIGEVKSSIDQEGVNITVNDCPAQTVHALDDLPMSKFQVNGAGQIRDIAPLANCPLTTLEIGECPIKNLNVVANFPALTELCVQSTPVRDLSPLRGRQLQRIVMYNTPVRDLSPLEGMPLRMLYMANVPATNLNVLAGLPLEKVYLGHPDLVMDLSSLAGKKLSILGLVGRVNAFAPLKDMSLSLLLLSFDWARVPDAAKLPEYIPALETLEILPPGKAEAEIIQRFQNLQKVNIVTAPGAWKIAASMTFDDFKKKFGRKEKKEPKSAKSKPK